MAWDSTMRIAEGKSDEEMAHIVYTRFTSGDTKAGIKYSLGGLYVHPIVTRVSVKAFKGIVKVDPTAVISGRGVNYERLQVVKMGITREHVIPVAELYEHLVKIRSLTEKYILDLMSRLQIALISNVENEKLKKAHLNSSMPDGWWKTQKLDPFDRYRAAGLNDSIWIKDF